MFWVVQAGAVAATVILYWVLRSTKGDVQPQERTKVEDRFPAIFWFSWWCS